MTAKRLAQEFVGPTGFRVARVDAHGNEVALIISGSGEPPLLSELGTKLSDTLDWLTRVRLVFVSSEQQVFEAEPE